MFLRTLSRGALAALLCAAAPVMPAAAAAPATPGVTPVAAMAASLGGPIYPIRGRYLLVDAASARLFMFEDGEVVDSMRVIVGKPAAQTPTIASQIYYATLNPYWNVPADLAQTLIAPNVLKQGVGYLSERGYQVLASFDPDAPEISPRDVDWKAVAAGREKVKVRQLPGPGNSMGEVKFGFPNGFGIFLHDTPKKELFESDERALSNGCVRLEDAPRLARWLLGRDPSVVAAGDEPEQHVLLPKAMPIYITYLDEPENRQLAVAQLSFAGAPR
ncbi:MAG TPA: L,D-transpeptidase family protein [Sphingomicrobium sp.]|nr:L,D-transpeptidase family protein [Sphingomicrobium sp.]